MSVLESVLEKLTQRSTAIASQFDEMVVAIADGRDVNASRLAEAIEAAGKTPDDLRASVELLQKRRELRAAFDAKPVATKRVAEIDAVIGKIEAKREAFDKKCDDDRWPLDGERDQLQATIVAAGNAQRELYATCADPEILDRSKEIMKEVETIDATRRKLKDDRDRFSASAVSAHKTATSTCETDGRRVFANEDAQKYSTYCVTLDQQIAALETDRAKLLAEQSELDARRLEP
jgi:chromosome segregation ATPase